MWPYNYCEWKSITYGIKKSKSKLRKHKNLILMCTVPSIVLIWMISLVF
jgi:hypothetical protein